MNDIVVKKAINVRNCFPFTLTQARRCLLYLSRCFATVGIRHEWRKRLWACV